MEAGKGWVRLVAPGAGFAAALVLGRQGPRTGGRGGIWTGLFQGLGAALCSFCNERGRSFLQGTGPPKMPGEPTGDMDPVGGTNQEADFRSCRLLSLSLKPPHTSIDSLLVFLMFT